jgi:hypothetical protein
MTFDGELTPSYRPISLAEAAGNFRFGSIVAGGRPLRGGNISQQQPSARRTGG